MLNNIVNRLRFRRGAAADVIDDLGLQGEALYITDTGQFLIHDGTSFKEIRFNGTVPSTASDTGSAGQIAWDANYIYICTATDTWKRVGISTW